MSVFEFNCLYAAKALFMVFVVAPMLFMLGVSLVYAVSQFLGSIWNAIILHRFPILLFRFYVAKSAATGPPYSARCMAATRRMIFAAAEKGGGMTDGYSALDHR